MIVTVDYDDSLMMLYTCLYDRCRGLIDINMVAMGQKHDNMINSRYLLWKCVCQMASRYIMTMLIRNQNLSRRVAFPSTILMPGASKSTDILLTQRGFTCLGIVCLSYCKIMPLACIWGTSAMQWTTTLH